MPQLTTRKIGWNLAYLGNLRKKTAKLRKAAEFEGFGTDRGKNYTTMYLVSRHRDWSDKIWKLSHYLLLLFSCLSSIGVLLVMKMTPRSWFFSVGFPEFKKNIWSETVYSSTQAYVFLTLLLYSWGFSNPSRSSTFK